MAKVNLSPLSIDAEGISSEQAIRKIISYLFQQHEQLRYELTHIDEHNMSDSTNEEMGVSSAQIRKSVADILQGGGVDLSGNETIRQLNEQMAVMQTTLNQARQNLSDRIDWMWTKYTALASEVELLTKRVKALEDEMEEQNQGPGV